MLPRSGVEADRVLWAGLTKGLDSVTTSFLQFLEKKQMAGDERLVLLPEVWMVHPIFLFFL